MINVGKMPCNNINGIKILSNEKIGLVTLSSNKFYALNEGLENGVLKHITEGKLHDS